MEKNQEIRKDNLINLFDEKGNRHGYWERYWSNGKLTYKGNYVNGNRHGYWESYFSDGQLNYKGNYVNGKPHGYWDSYWDNGELDYKGFYDMGKEVSYNPNEPKAIELTLDEIALKLNIPVEQLKIKK